MPPASSSIPVDDVLSIVREHVKDTKTIHDIAQAILATQKEIAKANAAEKGSLPKMKNRYVVLIRSDNAAALKPLVGAGCYIMTVPDDDTIDTYSGEGLLNRITKAARVFNDSLKKNRATRAIRTFVQAMEGLTSKAIKGSDSSFRIKAKYPAEVVVVENESIL